MLGRALLACHQFEQAEAAFRHALRQRPERAAHKALKELIWMRSSHPALATEELNRALATNPRANDLRIAKARLLAAAGEKTLAIAELQAGLRQTPGDPALRLAAAQAELAVDSAQALSQAERAFQMAPRRFPVVTYRLNGLWSARLRPSGHHLNHFHDQGWLTSARYIELPPPLGASNGEGWLKFGEPSFPGALDLGAEYFLKLEPSCWPCIMDVARYRAVHWRLGGLTTDRGV